MHVLSFYLKIRKKLGFSYYIIEREVSAVAIACAIVKTSSLAKPLTGVKGKMIKAFGNMRSEGMAQFLMPARDSSTRILIFLKTEIFSLLEEKI